MFTETQISDFLAELMRQAKGKSYLSGFYWVPLEKIAGPKAHEVFFILMKRGLLREEVIPGTYGDCIYHFTTDLDESLFATHH